MYVRVLIFCLWSCTFERCYLFHFHLSEWKSMVMFTHLSWQGLLWWPQSSKLTTFTCIASQWLLPLVLSLWAASNVLYFHAMCFQPSFASSHCMAALFTSWGFTWSYTIFQVCRLRQYIWRSSCCIYKSLLRTYTDTVQDGSKAGTKYLYFARSPRKRVVINCALCCGNRTNPAPFYSCVRGQGGSIKCFIWFRPFG